VAGYLGSTAQWERFNARWKSLLADYGASQMHRADLECFQREFKSWDSSRRTEFVKKAHSIIKKHTYVAVATGVIKADFEQVMPSWVKKLFGGVYGWCANECLVHVGKWCEKRSYRDPINWVFEAGTAGHGQVSDLFEALHEHPEWGPRLCIGSWSFEDKSVVPLQAADTIAYEVFKHIENQIIDQGKRTVRLSVLDLVRPSDESYLKYWDRGRLQKSLLNWEAKTRALAAKRPAGF